MLDGMAKARTITTAWQLGRGDRCSYQRMQRCDRDEKRIRSILGNPFAEEGGVVQEGAFKSLGTSHTQEAIKPHRRKAQ